ncbi:STE3-domain-containing protein [Peniophora sp. CONT]|nr:STE3-domain-containing protein [Peniophora sp. CONT]
MGATDPTYPFLPIMCILASVLLLSMLLNGLVRQHWNIGVAFLCFWLLVDNIMYAVNTVAWSDNFTVKFYIYCDIMTHLRFMSSVAEPMATFLIARRLFSIASLRTVEPDSKKAVCLLANCNLSLSTYNVLTLCTDYVVQAERFQVLEVFGCSNALSDGALTFSILFLSSVLIPLISVTIYYPARIVWVFYFHGRDVNRFLRSNDSVSRLNYFRLLALSSIDVLFTLPIYTTDAILTLSWITREDGRLPFYLGWVATHMDWEPTGFSYDDLQVTPTNLARLYVTEWSSPVLAFITFGLFGLTAEARASYYRCFCAIARRFGWDPTWRRRARNARSTLGSMQFGVQSPGISLNAGVGYALLVLDILHDLSSNSHSTGQISVSSIVPAARWLRPRLLLRVRVRM